MATGDSADILGRVRKLLPSRWFAWTAPYRDAIIGGVSDLASWCYNWITYARSQSRLATANGPFLDIYSYDFLGRAILRNGATDTVFRAQIQATILKERVTRHGMFQAVKTLTGNDPWIFEPWNPGDCGAYSNQANGIAYGQFGYGVGRGGYGNMAMPGQVLMQVVRGAPSGVPEATGYGGYAGGYGQGAIEYVGSYTRQIGVTDQQIENLITYTKPSGVTVWMQFV